MMFSNLSLSRHKATSKASPKTSIDSSEQAPVKQLNRPEFSQDYQQLIKANLQLRQQYSELARKCKSQGARIEQLELERQNKELQVKELRQRIENLQSENGELALKLMKAMLVDKVEPERRSTDCNNSLREQQSCYPIDDVQKYRGSIQKIMENQGNHRSSIRNTIGQHHLDQRITLKETLQLFLKHHFRMVQLYSQKVIALQQQVQTMTPLADSVQSLNRIVPQLQSHLSELSLLRKKDRLSLAEAIIHIKVQQQKQKAKVLHDQGKTMTAYRCESQDECDSVEEEMEMIRQSHIGYEEQSEGFSVYRICKKVMEEHLKENESQAKKTWLEPITRHSSRQSNRHSTRQLNRQSGKFLGNEGHQLHFPLFHFDLHHQSLAFYLNRLNHGLPSK